MTKTKWEIGRTSTRDGCLAKYYISWEEVLGTVIVYFELAETITKVGEGQTYDMAFRCGKDTIARIDVDISATILKDDIKWSDLNLCWGFP